MTNLGMNNKCGRGRIFNTLWIVVACAVASSSFGQSSDDWRTSPVYSELDEARIARSQGLPIHRLDLTKKRLKEVPEELAQWTELKEVILDRNKLKSIDIDLSAWSELVIFSAESNDLSQFPLSSLTWSQLENLRLGDNIIDSIPLGIDGLSQLKALSLWSNVISHYPASLGDLPRLEVLDVQYNDMTLEEQEMLKSWLPARVEVRMSAPCRCEFDE